MTELEIKAMADNVNNSVAELKRMVESSATDRTKMEEKFNAELSKFSKLVEDSNKIEGKSTAEYVKNVQEQLNIIEKKLNDQVAIQGNCFEDVVSNFVHGNEFKSALKGGQYASLELKAGEVTTANSFTQGTLAPIIAPYRNPTIASDPMRTPLISDLSRIIPVSMTDAIEYIYRSAETRNGAVVAEGTGPTASKIGWTSAREVIKKIKATVKISTEKIEDTDFVQAEVMRLLNEELMYQLNYGMMGGSLTNILTTAKAFNATYAGVSGVVSANTSDAVEAAIAQAMKGNPNGTGKQGFVPNAVLFGIGTKAKTRIEKASDGHYINDELRMNGTIGGVRVYGNDYISEGEVLVGDFSKNEIYMRKGITIKMYDQNGTDAVDGFVTVVAEMRVLNIITPPNAYAFVADSINDIKQAIEGNGLNG